ncbi:hypothetical protein G5V59_03245 [Nocardioides sp. W3-2-3]|nr:hypothetical protein [Nocardioides convexus]
MRSWLVALRSPLWVSRVVLVVGAVSLLSAYLPGIGARVRLVHEVVPASFPAAATTGGAAIGVMLVVLSRGLRRGKARAWTVALLLTFVAGCIHLLRGLQVEQAALCGLFVVQPGRRPQELHRAPRPALVAPGDHGAGRRPGAGDRPGLAVVEPEPRRPGARYDGR